MTNWRIVSSKPSKSIIFFSNRDKLLTAYVVQGHRDTWYTGAAFMSHDASVLWNFTQSVVLPKLLA